MHKNILITGAAGHLASAIIRELDTGNCHVRGLIMSNEKGVEKANTRYYVGDVTKPESLDPLFEGLDPEDTVVIHTAAIISIQAKVGSEVHNVNVNGTKNILAKCRQYKVKRLVYISSVHAIPAPDRVSTLYEVSRFPKDEVVGAYAITKAEASQAVLDAGKEGLDVVVLHPSGIIGPYDPGNNHMVDLILKYLRRKLPAGVTGGYDFVDVRDVAGGIISAIDKGRKGECYILSNRYVTVSEILEFLRLATGRKRKTPLLPLGLVKVMAPAFEWIARITNTRALFTGYSLHTLESNGYFSHDKATIELGYRPRDIKHTINDTVDWLIAEKDLDRARYAVSAENSILRRRNPFRLP